MSATGTMIGAGVAGLTGIGLALVLAVLTTTSLAGSHTRRRSDRSGVQRLGGFLSEARVRASARRAGYPGRRWLIVPESAADGPGQLLERAYQTLPGPA